MPHHPPFDTVVRDHGATVLRVCRAVVGPVDADDAWSETFLAALRAYPDLAPGANLQAWLVTIAHRKAIDLVRARARRPVPAEHLPNGQRSAGATESVEPADVTAQRHDDADAVWTAVAQLPTRQRQAVAYHHLGGLPYPEVAALTGGSAAAARRAGADGIATLRTLLHHDQTEEP